MVAFFSSWAQGIIVAVIIATIIEMVLPNGTSKKYVKVIIGIYILFTIISPIINKFSNEKINFNQILATEEYEQKIAASDNNISQKIESNNSRTIKDIYTSNLEMDIKSKLKEKGYGISSTYIKVKDDKNYTIEKISLDLYKQKESADKQEEKSEVNKVSINQIDVTIIIDKENSNNKNSEQIDESEKKLLKEYLSNTYEVDLSKIEIT